MKPSHQKTKRAQRLAGSQQLPVNNAPSNEAGDRMSMGLLYVAMILAAGIFIGGLVYAVLGIVDAVHAPVQWMKLAVSIAVIILAAFAARSVAGLALFGSVMIASRQGAWKTLESVSRKGLEYRKLLPGGVNWLSTALVQSLVNRGQYADACTISDKEWELCGENEKLKQGLGSLCFAAGMAKQGENDLKGSQIWNDRAVLTLEQSLEEMKKPPKGMMQKLASTQSKEFEGQVRMQLAAAYFNSAGMFFNSQDFRRAKEHFRRAADNASKSPDFPQKQDIIKFSNEQLARLKHN